MVYDRADVGFIPVEWPGGEGTGASHSSALLIEHLSIHHDLTVYVTTQHSGSQSALPARERVNYVINDGISMLPHPIWNTQSALADEIDQLNSHDLIHSYSSAFIPTIADLDVPTIVTLNSYLPICPKADFRYRCTNHCTGPGLRKCATCLPFTAFRRQNGLISECKSLYLSAGRSKVVRDSMATCDSIDAYHVLSPHLRDDYVKNGFPSGRMSVIPHFYDPKFSSVSNGSHRLHDPPRILYVGALRSIKGVEVLIRAVAELARREQEVLLDIVGSGPQRSKLHQLTSDLGIENHIRWHGYIDNDNLPKVYNQSDVFVYPGVIEEPFGRVILEALASRTPIVSSDIGSMDEHIGNAGVMFEPGNEIALACALINVFDNYNAIYRSIPDQLARFAPKTVIDQLLGLYGDVLNQQL